MCGCIVCLIVGFICMCNEWIQLVSTSVLLLSLSLSLPPSKKLRFDVLWCITLSNCFPLFHGDKCQDFNILVFYVLYPWWAINKVLEFVESLSLSLSLSIYLYIYIYIYCYFNSVINPCLVLDLRLFEVATVPWVLVWLHHKLFFRLEPEVRKISWKPRKKKVLRNRLLTNLWYQLCA